MSWTTTPWPKAATYAARLWIWWPNAWRSTTGPAIPMTKCKPFLCPLGPSTNGHVNNHAGSGRQEALAAPLDLNNVKQRKGAGGRKLDYISGEHAIAEANRIFGFDGWSCETVHMECVKENPPTYIARVRVRAGGVTREGWGGDNGNDHENAVKGAETDAIKRALRTFGNQFGLPLYDKEENAENLTRGSEPAPTPRPAPSAEYKRHEKVSTKKSRTGPSTNGKPRS